MSDGSRAVLPEKYWHIAASKKAAKAEPAIENDLSFTELKRKLVLPWHDGRSFVIAGTVFRSRDEVESIRVSCTDQPMTHYAEQSDASWQRTVEDFSDRGFMLLAGGPDRRLAAVHEGVDYTSELLFDEPPGPKAIDGGHAMASNVTTKASAILFLDVVGWSKLTASQIRTFIEKALPAMGAIVRKRDATMVNTWGDAIVAVYDSAVDCAESALDLCDFFQKAKASDGVAPGTSARIGVHFGEVFWTTNPITGHQDVFGPAVHTAARLEPVAAAGHAFCTVDFARMLGAVEGEAPRAHRIGNLSLAKGYGEQEIYVLTWPNAPAPPFDRFRAPEKYDELATLRERLNDVRIGGDTLLSYLEKAARASTFKTAKQLLTAIAKAGCSDRESPFWWLTVHGVLEYDNIENWWDDDEDTAANSVAYSRISPRGEALLEQLRR